MNDAPKAHIEHYVASYLVVGMLTFFVGHSFAQSPPVELGTTIETVLTGVLVLTTIVYAILTNRIAQASSSQAEAMREGLKKNDEQLEVLREQLAAETTPKLFTMKVGPTSSSGAIRLDKMVLAVHNFNRYPLLIDYFKYRFKHEENRTLFETSPDSPFRRDMLKHHQVRPFENFRIPFPTTLLVGNEQPELRLYFYYGGSGSVRYLYRAIFDRLGNPVEESISPSPVPRTGFDLG